MTPTEFKKSLQSADPVFGTLITSPSPFWPKVIGDCGLDFVFIDTEHIALNRETVSWMCRTYRAMGLPPLVRIPNQDPNTATMVLDDGAVGIVVPYVESAQIVQEMVHATKHRPIKGRRLAEFESAADSLDPILTSYVAETTKENLLFVNIESVPAMEALDEILAVDGLDGILIGPHDLSTSLDIPEHYSDETFLNACRQIIRRARDANKVAGIHHWLDPDSQAQFIRMGANLLIHKADVILFRTGIQAELKEIREGLGDTRATGGAAEVSI